MFLEGDRVRLRPTMLSDAAAAQQWINDPAVAHYLRPPYQFSIVAEEEFLQSKLENDWERGIFLAIEAIDIGNEPRHIGSIELRNLSAESRRGELGILIGDREFWSAGYGEDSVRTMSRYGFDELDLHRIELTVGAYNPRAQRCYEKVGFIVEGRMREHRYVGGAYHDTIGMGLLRRDFEANEVGRAR